ncbi:MAG: phosphoribosylamine--glycine ligase [Bacteroidales bacterium]|nr:phosphoribosylamine--glycine ligase [Bacteroidales bacterium]
MNVLILGSGGREHALAWKIAQSPLLNKLYCAPGNPGSATCATNLPVDISCFEDIKQLVLHHNMDMVVVGPEDPLVSGIVDFFASDPELSRCFVVGPTQLAAQLEGSKEFAKAFMQRHSIPTASYASFSTSQVEEAVAYLTHVKAPYVLKADGLAAGKGVVILSDIKAAKQEVRNILGGKFGSAGNRIVIEEFLEGIELSLFFLTDGKSYQILPQAKDYKRIGDGDTGLNTGGMGAVSPVPFADDLFLKKVEESIIRPTVAGLASEKIDYKGFVFVGLMNCKGDPYVIEYNVRLGDPETEVLMPRIQSDLLALLVALSNGNLSREKLTIAPDYALTVVMASGGYPQAFKKEYPIEGLNITEEGAIVFQAGTKYLNDTIVTSGGRVLAVTAKHPDLAGAIDKAYRLLHSIEFKDAYYRKDVGQDLLSL